MNDESVCYKCAVTRELNNECLSPIHILAKAQMRCNLIFVLNHLV